MTSEARKGKTEKKGFLYNMTHYKEYYIMLIPGILFFWYSAMAPCMDWSSHFRTIIP